MVLLTETIPAPAPSPLVVLSAAGEDDRPFVLASGPGDPRIAAWSYAGLEAIDRVGGLPRGVPGAMAVGYVGYDLGWRCASRPRVPRVDPLGMPGAAFQIYDAVYARSERTGAGMIAGTSRERMARLRAAVMEARMPAVTGGLASPLSPRVSRAVHLSRVRECLELVAAGEIYQVNLTYALEGRYRGSPVAAFMRLLRAAPPFAALLRVDRDAWIVSASPECFFDFDAGTRELAVYPIKGTRPRSEDAAADRALAAELVADEKERAEHMMIVDLLRNDVGRIAATGSVAVDGLCYVESFPRVHHLTSRVVGRVRAGVALPPVMDALFPGGSITGVPKLRAMEVIDELEGEARGVYTGAIGYVTPGGSCRASIAIRTAQIVRGEVRFGVGGGIVADSVPEREWEETEIKARALSEALEG